MSDVHDQIFERVASVGSLEREPVSLPETAVVEVAQQRSDDTALLSMAEALTAALVTQRAVPNNQEIHVHVGVGNKKTAPAAQKSHRIWPYVATASLIATAVASSYVFRDEIKNFVDEKRGIKTDQSETTTPGSEKDTILPDATCIAVPNTVDEILYDEDFILCMQPTGIQEKIPNGRGGAIDAEAVYTQFIDPENGDLFSASRIEAALTDPNTATELGQIEFAVHTAAEQGDIISPYISLYLVQADGEANRLVVNGKSVHLETGV